MNIILKVLFFTCFIFPTFVHCEDMLNIGVIAAFSGDGAGYSESLRNGIELGLSELPPEVADKIKFHYEDDALMAKNATSAFQKLSRSMKLDGIVAFSTSANALVSLTERAAIPLLALTSEFNVCENKKYAFNFWVSAYEEAKAVFEEAKKRGYRKIARISTTHSGIAGINQAFDELNNGIIPIVLDEDYPLEVKDFRPYLTRLRFKKDFDAIFINLLPGQAGIFAKQTRELNFQVPLFDVEIFEDKNEVKMSQGALIGQWYVSSDRADANFLKRYHERFSESSSYASAHGYDIAMHYGEIYKKGLRGNEAAQYFNSLKNYKGALGSYSATGDHRFTLPVTVKVVAKPPLSPFLEQ